MRLLIVEDHDELVGLLRRLLAEAGYASDHASTGEDARLMLELGSYAAVVLDIGLPDGDGREVARQLRAGGDTTPVILLTARGSVEDRVAGLAAGGDDYLVKPFAPEELVARVQALLRRSGLVADRPIACGNLRFDPATREVRVAGRPAVLFARELALFELLIQRRERVVAKAQIEAQLFGMEEPLGSNALEVCVHRLRRRLAEAGASAQIVTVRGVGYMLAETGA